MKKKDQTKISLIFGDRRVDFDSVDDFDRAVKRVKKMTKRDFERLKSHQQKGGGK